MEESARRSQRQSKDREGVLEGYSDVHTPLGGYAALAATWSGIFGGLLLARARADELPSRIPVEDMILLGVATHKLTRTLTKDWVTAPLRAPFVRYEGSAGGGEVKEKARGRGLRKAVGDLLTCPWCTGPWVAAALTSGLLRWPRPTRVVAGTFAMVTISDFLHHAYDKVAE